MADEYRFHGVAAEVVVVQADAPVQFHGVAAEVVIAQADAPVQFYGAYIEVVQTIEVITGGRARNFMSMVAG